MIVIILSFISIFIEEVGHIVVNCEREPKSLIVLAREREKEKEGKLCVSALFDQSSAGGWAFSLHREPYYFSKIDNLCMTNL